MLLSSEVRWYAMDSNTSNWPSFLSFRLAKISSVCCLLSRLGLGDPGVFQRAEPALPSKTFAPLHFCHYQLQRWRDHVPVLRGPYLVLLYTMASSARRVAAPIDAGGKGGDEPELKRQRPLDAGGPIEDDETARQKMRDAKVYERGVDGTEGEYVGFDPDNVRDVKTVYPYAADVDAYDVTPMGYFAEKGDLPMMRWLYVNGADTRDEDVPKYFPMYTAAMNGRFEACKWLFDHGAAGDVERRADHGFTPLAITFGKPLSRDLSRWLILMGALCKDDGTGDLDVDLMRDSLIRFHGSTEERLELLKWAREHHQSRSYFYMFLMGTLSEPKYSATKLRNELLARNRSEKAVDRLLECVPPDQYHLLWADLFAHRVGPLAAFSGKSGILELIGDYVGIVRGREARIIRQLTELLPGLIEELENRRYESSSDSDDSDESSDDSDH